jgi:hypothetical protein
VIKFENEISRVVASATDNEGGGVGKVKDIINLLPLKTKMAKMAAGWDDSVYNYAYVFMHNQSDD